MIRRDGVKLVIDIPQRYGEKLVRNELPQVNFLIDGAFPMMADNVKSYIQGIMTSYETNLSAKGVKVKSPFEVRFSYNENFESVYVMVPGIIMMALMMLPCIMTALGVVREKELGTITNLYTCPATVFQFLLGKQLPYIALAFASFLTMILTAVIVLGVPVTGSLAALSYGALLTVMASTAFGLLVSSFVKSQIAALLGAAVITILPTINFSGFLYPISTLSAGGKIMGLAFPSAWFNLISLGTFTKGLGFESFSRMYLYLFGFRNLTVLTFKEVKSVASDVIMMIFMIYLCTVAVVMAAQNITTEVRNASVAITDHDGSTISRKIAAAIVPPYFRKPDLISDSEIQAAMDLGEYTFVIDIPPDFEENRARGLNPSIMLIVDATAMTQAAAGTSYLTSIIQKELSFDGKSSRLEPVRTEVNVLFNPNSNTVWHIGITQMVGALTLLTLMLTGSAVIREKERGTMEHLLVMPITAVEICLAKIIANSAVILTIAGLSMWFVVRCYLSVPLAGSFWLYIGGSLVYLICVASLGILLSIEAPTMPQFGLLCLPVYIILYLLSGALTPLENIPAVMRSIMTFSPTTDYSSFTQDVLIRGAGIDTVYPQLLVMGGESVFFLILSLLGFRSMLSKQG